MFVDASRNRTGLMHIFTPYVSGNEREHECEYEYTSKIPL